MRPLIISCLLYAGASAFQVPHNLPDGDYRITYGDTPDTEPLVRRFNPIAKRWSPVPRGLHSGTAEYNIVVDEDVTPAKISEVNLDTHHTKSSLPLLITDTGCYHKIPYPLDHADHAASKQSLLNYCSLYNFHRAHIELSLHGKVAVFVCNTQSHTGSKWCSEGEFNAAEAVFNKTCGADNAAWVFMADTNKMYGRAWRGTNICRPEKDWLPNGKGKGGFVDNQGAKVWPEGHAIGGMVEE
ncbi:hypothetical protein BGZ61DRAFT_530852 [Ilyonectria robusta]|uniref:uncharacterized protein n=1 Tax=Ilyonectria robusta TaxID=1079257 RepID=UPI001E8D640C|nr:uncharacterized protein BGZ61DRAFT_530852 [Ilyonectria robusta]KAH8714195.1 hypothetical protein BGZ61DRAFT_530852 [Ilyonectria robusta]